MEAQACGLPALVSDEGGPKTIVLDGLTGRVVHGEDPSVWADAIEHMLDDAEAWQRMSAAAAERLRRYSLSDTFEDFWAQHEAVVSARTGVANGSRANLAAGEAGVRGEGSGLRNVAAL
jgi:glycosyltransferase involved in cell wall biosynthesis